MAAQSALFGSTALIGLNKKGILKPDAEGYYELTVGAFNIHNNAGVYYPLGVAKALFEESASLMRRVRAATLRGEYGHPRRENMNPAQFTKRLNEIYEDRVCCHFGDIRLDQVNYKSKSGFPQIATIAKLKPSGPFGPSLQGHLDNPKEEVCFSVRAAAMQEIIGGQENRCITDIVTWDYVNEGGIGIARKYFSMALESIDGGMVPFDQTIITPTVLQLAADSAIVNMGLESNDAQRLLDLQRNLGWGRPKGVNFPSPATLAWK